MSVAVRETENSQQPLLVASDEVGRWAGEGSAGQAKALSLGLESKGNLLPSLALVKVSDIIDVGVL